MEIKEKYVHSDIIGKISKPNNPSKKKTYLLEFLNIFQVFSRKLLALLFVRQFRFCFTYLNLSILKNKKFNWIMHCRARINIRYLYTLKTFYHISEIIFDSTVISRIWNCTINSYVLCIFILHRLQKIMEAPKKSFLYILSDRWK